MVRAVVGPGRREILANEGQQELDRPVAEDSTVTARFAAVEEVLAAGVHVSALGAPAGLKVKGSRTKPGRTRVFRTFVQD
ncbi:hypothetical protein [Lentzea sp. NPDC059081]|uniref:hypothetical protein n=1 Tax=Lentzea sp. NPDC059081 TaxID=3346719 RepID=UPI003698D0EA